MATLSNPETTFDSFDQIFYDTTDEKVYAGVKRVINMGSAYPTSIVLIKVDLGLSTSAINEIKAALTTLSSS